MYNFKYSQINKNHYAGYNKVYVHYALSPLGSVMYGKARATVVPTNQLGNTDKVVISLDTETESVTKIVSAMSLRPIVDGLVDQSVRSRMGGRDEDRSRKGKKADREELRVEVIQRKKPLRG